MLAPVPSTAKTPISALHQFPQGFLWGCATAAHQVEGGNTNDWWRWEQTPGHIHENQRSGGACEWWQGRYEEDFDRAAAMNNNAQRISVEWSRVEPEPGRWDDYALEKYRAMLQALRARGMTPMVTLHHFTNPLWVADDDGWAWEGTPARFATFARKVVSALGDLCSLWCTINEPMIYVTLHYLFGERPPGLKNRGTAYRVFVNMVRGHTLAYHAIKEVQPTAQVGFANHNVHLRPRWGWLLNRLAVSIVDSFVNRAFMSALHTGVAAMPGGGRTHIPNAKGALDWVGLQYYQAFDVGFNLFRPLSLFVEQVKPTDIPTGPKAWGGLIPGAIFNEIANTYKLLGKPIYVTEAGVPDPTDTLRMGYLIETVRAMWKAVNFNYPVKGFFHWSLLDNFEWTEGFDPRFNFGLYQTNFETQERTPRRSAKLYGEICAANGLSSEIVANYASELLATLFPGEAGLKEVRLKPGGNRVQAQDAE
jgi:beta-glucosidase